MKSTKIIITIFGIALILFGAVSIINAQAIFDPLNTGVVSQQISTSVVPENPTSGQEVTISLKAYGTNLNNASISWSINGKVVQSGTGIIQYSLNAGKNGETKKVVVNISPTNGPSIIKTFNITPQEVSIVYEADGYVPPFYKGKGSYTREGSVTFVAVPNLISNGAKLNPNSLNYKWIVDGTVQGSKSGYGKSSFSYTGSILGNEPIVQVEVSSASGNVKGMGTILLSLTEPEVVVYEKNPLYGLMFNKEISSNGLTLKEKEVTVSAFPFSTSAISSKSSNLEYSWSINNLSIPAPKNQSYATFRNSAGEKGSSLIGVSVSNTTHLLQSMRKSLSLNF